MGGTCAADIAGKLTAYSCAACLERLLCPSALLKGTRMFRLAQSRAEHSGRNSILANRDSMLHTQATLPSVEHEAYRQNPYISAFTEDDKMKVVCVSKNHNMPSTDAIIKKVAADVAASRMPIEVWNNILDYLRDEPAASVACYQAIKLFRRNKGMKDLPRALEERMAVIADQSDAYRLAEAARADADYKFRVRVVEVVGSKHGAGSTYAYLTHLSTFAAMFSGSLPQLREFVVRGGEWRTGAIPTSTCRRF
ncbi:hypothetical protein WOLCODRAFT_144791 [Wolfiporia cocos MD-104 SS10]|uniref:Uncharacterized protein n=1 Tax=Wolfiporia cocos (strain MD-104) TaxID=742152 RepID=A0A2H3K6I2_WOLCO|nr:hypothetical protein WOLCODRAFT_144791 [Wolfiporia cocos MD-104 SS10]